MGRRSAAVHLVVAWALLLLGFAAPGFLAYSVATHFSDAWPESGALVIVVVVLSAAAIAVIGVALFAVLWFSYLRLCVGAERSPEVEARLRVSMQVALMEPIYSRIRGLIYGSSTHHA